jgi:prepilin-type N-terminal cleavage/methylation domain-containing protein
LNRQSGFTLVEVIAVLVLVSLLAVIAGMGIIRGIEGYLFARENAVMAQKAQFAMARIRLEMNEIMSVENASVTSIEFTTPDGARKIGLDIEAVRLVEDDVALTDGDILIDNVNVFSLIYMKNDGTVWTTSDDIMELSEIRIDLVLNHKTSQTGTVSFFTTVNPGNTGVARGPVG